MEVKCPYSPLNNPAILPIAYEVPQYNGCQVLTHMKCTNSNVLLFVSCGVESLSVSLWILMRQHGTASSISLKKCTQIHNVVFQMEIQPESLTLKEEIKVYCKSNSLLVAEVPTLHTVDDEYLSTSRMAWRS